MAYWNGTVYDAGTLTANGNSGFIAMPIIGAGGGGVKRATLRVVPADLATDEELSLDLNIGFDSSGSGDVKVHDFTNITATNVAELVFLPGGESEGNLYKELGTNAGILSAVVPPWLKFVWALTGTTKSMTFVCYGILEY